MLNYFNSYKNFLRAKTPRNPISRDEMHSKGFEIHHIVPKSEGGKGHENNVWLSEYDHCIAHVLLNVARIQVGITPLPYAFRKCFTKDYKHNSALYWNPLSKLKVCGTNKRGVQTKTMTLLEASFFAAKRCGAITNWKANRIKNAFVKQILRATILPNVSHKFVGLKWKIVF